MNVELQSMENSLPPQSPRQGAMEKTKKAFQNSFLARVIKLVVMGFIGVIYLACLMMSKLTFASITGNVSHAVTHCTAETDTAKNHQTSKTLSVNFVQLTLLLAIPDVVSLAYCFFRGVLGKTTKKHPWPKKKFVAWGVLLAIFEVIALCGFVFGVACLLSPSLTVLVLNGVFGAALVLQIVKVTKRGRDSWRSRRDDYENLENGCQTNHSIQAESNGSNGYVKIKPAITHIACLIHLLAICSLLAVVCFEVKERQFHKQHYFFAVLLVISLILLSLIWSGWVQKFLMKPCTSIGTYLDRPSTTRIKTGFFNSFIRLLCLPFCAYGFAQLLLNKCDNLSIDVQAGFESWSGNEASTFLTQIFTTFLAYLFAQLACGFQSFLFFIPLLLSTPASIAFIVICFKATQAFFPFENSDQQPWPHFYVFLIAGVFWITQLVIYLPLAFLKYPNVLLKEEQLFWAPRYNGSFIEQYLLLNRRTSVNGDDSNGFVAQNMIVANEKRYVFICSTMYHEKENEMKQLLESIDHVAMTSGNADANGCPTIYESHIFFDNACSGEQFNPYVMTLLGLLRPTLGIKPNDAIKIRTSYGFQLQYVIKHAQNSMKFYIHLKDNSKVKNKKRWSQVMYMRYVLNRIENPNTEGDRIDKANTYIVTTDADVDFTCDSVEALLDVFTKGDDIGAVCARTYPQGSGPIVWYQKFDYAIGHWFQKAAEDVLGCVLCCPGCFSAFRVTALEQVLSMYSTCVENGFDFLTKDMGEDRWLCTLLIENEKRLVYAAVSENKTFCPDTFEEFFKQRRRWIPSTMANLVQVISNHKEITSKNNSVTFLFILYQFIIVFSSLISPATVILIIVTGLTAVNENLNELALITVLIIVSFLYGVVCVYTTEKTQLQIAKALTFVFAILMAVVMSGIVNDVVKTVFSDSSKLLHPSSNEKFRFPIDTGVVYLSLFAFTFVVAGLLHFKEFFNLLHFFWYLLCLPSGYLVLTIYSFANINNCGWGTREEVSKKESKPKKWEDRVILTYRRFENFLRKCLCHKPPVEDPHLPTEEVKQESIVLVESKMLQNYPPKITEEALEWLTGIGCERYIENFEIAGYTEKCWIGMMTMEDLKDIGIDKRGFQLKLESAIKALPTPDFEIKVPNDVEAWLEQLKIPQYVELFSEEGYSTAKDVENLKKLSEDDLQRMGITRKAHLNLLIKALHYLQYPNKVEEQTNKTRNAIKKKMLDPTSQQDLDEIENKFWEKLVDDDLKPRSTDLLNPEHLMNSLNSLRNTCLLTLLLANVLWIVFLYIIMFPQLQKYNLPNRAFSLLFLAIFGFIVVVQFFAMLLHRLLTLFHWLARIKLLHKGNNGLDQGFQVPDLTNTTL